jgi:proteasome accessory factor A
MLPIMGVESEYVILLLLCAATLDTQGAATALMLEARDRLTHLCSPRSGIFLASGARFYIDAANHPEWCTAECTNPTDAVCQVRAGERHLRQLVEQIPGAALLRCNVSYARPCATWGSHESHLHTCSRPYLRRTLRPHLLTRIIYTGSGGLDPFDPRIVFSLSPRSMHCDRVGSSLHASSCLDGREESLACPPYKRGHINLGESVCLDLPLWLRLATTSLLVQLINEGLLTPKHVPDLKEPGEALHAIALDTTLAAPKGTAGSRHSALEIQHTYLELAERFMHHRSMPDWAPLACARWRSVLDTLAEGEAGAVECCEWALKHQVMTQYIARRGLDWQAVDRFNAVVTKAMSRSKTATRMLSELGIDLWESPQLRERITTEARRQGLDRGDVKQFLQLRKDLCELDMRFDMIPGGISDALEPQIARQVPEITDQRVCHAMTWPPQDTRAAIRGRYIRRLSNERDRYFAGWAGIRDVLKSLRLDLSHPFCHRARWKKAGPTLRERLLPCGGTIPPLEMD